MVIGIPHVEGLKLEQLVYVKITSCFFLMLCAAIVYKHLNRVQVIFKEVVQRFARNHLEQLRSLQIKASKNNF